MKDDKTTFVQLLREERKRIFKNKTGGNWGKKKRSRQDIQYKEPSESHMARRSRRRSSERNQNFEANRRLVRTRSQLYQQKYSRIGGWMRLLFEEIAPFEQTERLLIVSCFSCQYTLGRRACDIANSSGTDASTGTFALKCKGRHPQKNYETRTTTSGECQVTIRLFSLHLFQHSLAPGLKLELPPLLVLGKELNRSLSLSQALIGSASV